jgi:tetratricopeptide (TPR) repeat protein
MKRLKNKFSAAAGMLLAIAAMALMVAAPAVAQGPPATVHGTVTDPTGSPVTKGDIKFTLDKTGDDKNMKWEYTFPLDAAGNYKATDIKPGDYIVWVVQHDATQGDIRADYQEVVLKVGDDKTVNFDMTREDYMKSLSPERKKEIEEFKKKNAAISQSNKVIANLNATLAKVRADLAAASKGKDDVSQDVTDMQNATQAKGDESILWFVYGDTLQAQGDHLAKADRAAGKLPSSDDDTMKEYTSAVDAYKKSIALNQASKKPDVHTQAVTYTQMGNTLAHSGNIPDATAAYDNAVKLEPTSAGAAYGNEAVVLFNANQMDAALAAANKAIAADPTRADPYFIKGQALVGGSTIDPKTQKPVAPPGCIEAYQKYLELAPDGANAASVKEVLAGFDVKIDTSYKAAKTPRK